MVGVEERLLARIWERQLVAADNMVTGSGERLQVIHPGKENRDSGPDFLGAIIATDASGLLVGDVEIHRRVGDWSSHGHQHDPRYNGVILQVVWDGGGIGGAAKWRGGTHVEFAPLSGRLAG